MKILFIGASSELAIKLAQKLNFKIYGISRKRNNKYKEVFIVKSYSPKEIKKVIKRIKIQFDNVFIFNGIYSLSLLKFFDIKKFSETINTNFSSSILVINNLIKEDKIKKNGSINFISSHAGIYPEIGNAYYSISKHIINFSVKILSKEYKKNAIRFNSLLVGFVKTRLSNEILNTYSKKQIIQILKKQKNRFISIEKLVKFFEKICYEKKFYNRNILIK